MAPSSALGYGLLASALAAEGRPRVAIEEALSQKWTRLSGASATRAKLVDEAAVALLFGDFATARTKADELEHAVHATTCLAARRGRRALTRTKAQSSEIRRR